MISQRISSIGESITLAISAKAKEMKKRGIDIVSFGAGEPDFDTPNHIKEESKRTIDEGFTKYTPSSGINELKSAICKKFKEENNLEYKESQILISCGAKHSLFNAILALCQEKDQVIIPAPYWVSYPEMIKASGAKSVVLDTDEKGGFKVSPTRLKRAVTAKTKLLILNSPSNPSGTVYNKEELKEIAKVLVKQGIFCVSDEIYEKIIYDDAKHTSIASLDDQIKKLTVVVNGVSKSYSMTGWRIGYAAGPQAVIKAMSNLQSHSTSNPTSISQKAALAALKGPQGCVKDMVAEFSRRRDYILERINTIKPISCTRPLGAFYVFCNIQALLGKKGNNKTIKNSLDFCGALLQDAKVAVVPGVAFGKEGFLRLSYATSMENIKKGLDRIEEFVRKLY